MYYWLPRFSPDPWQSTGAFEDVIGAYREAGMNEFVIDQPREDQLPVLERVAAEVLPSGTALWLPVHAVGIVHMGLLIGEIFDLEALADDCERDGTYEFFFSAPPLPFTGAVGSPINPLAVK